MRLLFNRYVFALSLGHFIVDLFGNFPPILFSILRGSLGLTYGEIGLAAMVFSGGSSALQPVFGHLEDRFGGRWVQAASVAGVVCLVSIIGLAPSYPLLLVLLVLAGLGSSAYHPSAATKLAAVSGNSRGTALSIFSLGGNAGYALGPVVAAAVLLHFGLGGGMLLVIPGVIGALYIGLALKDIERHREAAQARVQAIDGHQIPVFAVAVLLLVTILRSWLQNALVLYLPQLFTDVSLSGQVLFVLLFGSAIGGVWGGMLADRIGGRLEVIGSLLLTAPAVYMFMHSSGLLALAVSFVAGALMGSSYPVTVVMAQEYMPRNVGVASGLMMGFAWTVGGLGIFAIGLSADQVGLAAALNILVFVPLAAGLLSLLLPRRPQPEPLAAGPALTQS